jgi:uncharacterized protein (TIGR02421 family)
MAVTEADLKVDLELAEIAGRLPLLSLVTPVNVPQARKAFIAGEEPQFLYRELPDLDAIAASLDAVDPTAADDPTVASLAEGLVKELRLRLELLRNRNTDQAFFVAVELFGHVEDQTLALAEQILGTEAEKETAESVLNAAEFAAVAAEEIARYRETYPELAAKVHISDTRPGVLVEAGDLYIGDRTRVAAEDVPGLLAHEVGTHVLTFANGRAQPLQMLSLGLAGYDELQEALGVLGEHLTGGIAPSRLRTLASRVKAAYLRSRGASFRETHDELVGLGFGRREAFTTVMRAYRGGGTTKDAIYLRGLVRLLDHLRSGVDLSSLYIGKISFEAISLIGDLAARGVLGEAPLRPAFLDEIGAQEKLEAIKNGAQLIDLGGRAA